MISKAFRHSGLIYEFKWAKRNQVLNMMPNETQKKLVAFFDKIYNNQVPHDLFNNRKIKRCSKFRIKYLDHGARKSISNYLIENNCIKVIQPEKREFLSIHEDIRRLPQMVKDIYQDYHNKGYFGYKPSHDEVLTPILLKNNLALAIETPVWTRKQTCLTDYMKSDEDLCFSYSVSLTGHIDLIMYDPTDQSVVVCDYKPEGVYLRSLPQVASYALLLKRILNISNIKCISFRKEDAWIYDPEIVRSDIEKQIQKYGNPQLKWRKILYCI